MAKLIWTDEALASLEAIYAYLSQHSPQAAHRIIQAIYKRSEILREFPRAGYLHRDSEGVEQRILLYGHYRIIYGIEEDQVGVIGVFHAAMDIDRHI